MIHISPIENEPPAAWVFSTFSARSGVARNIAYKRRHAIAYRDGFIEHLTARGETVFVHDTMRAFERAVAAVSDSAPRVERNAAAPDDTVTDRVVRRLRDVFGNEVIGRSDAFLRRIILEELECGYPYAPKDDRLGGVTGPSS